MGKLKCKKSKVCLRVEGHVLSEGYQVCRLLAARLYRSHGRVFAEPRVRGYLEVDWVEHVQRLQREVGGQTWALRGGVLVYEDGRLVGGRDELLDKYQEYRWTVPGGEVIRELARREYLALMTSGQVVYSWLALGQAGRHLGTVLFELRADLVERASLRFATLCQPDNRLGYSYRGGAVHRVCHGGWLQAGQLTARAGALEDETYCYPHDRRGVLSFANQGPHTNLCQFFVTFRPAPWMDGYYVAFGRVVEGWDTLARVERTPCTYESPDEPITIEDCGVVEVGLGQSVALTSRLRLKGLTLGQPLVDPNVFVDLLLDMVVEVLLQRLDPDVRRLLGGQWVAEMLWEKVSGLLLDREPRGDEPDTRDTSSDTLLAQRYLAGLYGPPDIPDLYIRRLLEGVLASALDRSQTLDMVRSIVRLLVTNADRLANTSWAEPVVRDIVDSLLDTVLAHIASSLQDPSAHEDTHSTTSTSRQSLISFIRDMLLTAITNETASV